MADETPIIRNLLYLCTPKKNVMAERIEYKEGKVAYRFLDLFAGAGGISEGFLQAEEDNKYFDFVLASDINDNCELTHLVRYNFQLGLNTVFHRQDIMEEDFLKNLLEKLNGEQIDVVTGGPSCQSFSLSGRRKQYDKRDDLFEHYLKVIRVLKPKYFVMENVKGLLTKDGGKIKERIIKEIRSLVDEGEVYQLTEFIAKLKKSKATEKVFILDCYQQKIDLEVSVEDKNIFNEKYIQTIENHFKLITKKVDYKVSKSDVNINTIRHGLNLLKRISILNGIKQSLVNEKTQSDIDNDGFVDQFNEFISFISESQIIENIASAFNKINSFEAYKSQVNEILEALKIYTSTLDECFDEMRELIKSNELLDEYETILNNIRLYNIEKPIVVNSSDYGVPQNRERVLFIGCRKDQNIITEIPPTVSGNDKVTVYEALYDLDFIGNGEEVTKYKTVRVNSKYRQLLKTRALDGKIDGNTHLTYKDWSKQGRLNHRFELNDTPFYVRNFEELSEKSKHLMATLHNHKTSQQKEEVKERLRIIAESGGYDESRKKLIACGLNSDKRNYNVLKADSQSPTVVTMPDDFIHYSAYRALTVREMARLQSFDDNFVFQGKRSTGGEKRKVEIPQYTLVGNAVPPLMARAIGHEILKKIQ